ncbi:MAG: YggS family pyridoxal phosphate-dependent enzyme [Proteobacteria bacterium]|nr:YggS family pyridoxal phosphate-dependent enzyme [Pseudomonadota bacterium]NOG60616.1 YggS family pyridoxal phosphate-dependent enzyme [Pseudomonadota bacterium]
MKITANLDQIHNEISSAEKQFQRKQGSVCLLAVSKTRTVDEIMTAFNSGQRHFGENYCQEAVEKIDALKQPDIVWHFIGPVQSNKTSLIARYFDWVHTVDRIKIARRLEESRPENAAPLNICIQINISGEESKSGIAIDETESFINELEQFKRLKVRGLMALPAPTDNFDKQRAAFSQLNNKLRRLNKANPDLDTLSIGTSQDMHAAIAEGATIVRIGTAIFGPRNYVKQ